MAFAYFLKGLIIGFSLAVPIGPIEFSALEELCFMEFGVVLLLV